MTRGLPAATPTIALALMVLARTRRGGLFRGIGIETVTAGAELLDLEIAGDVTVQGGKVTYLAASADGAVTDPLRGRLERSRNGVPLHEWLSHRGAAALAAHTEAAGAAGLLQHRHPLLGSGTLLRPEADVRRALVATVSSTEPLSAYAAGLATLVQGSGLGLTLGLRGAALAQLRHNAAPGAADPVVRALIDLPAGERQYVKFGQGLLEDGPKA